jgi:DNA replication protein DnaC
VVAAPDVLATARAQRWDPAEVLRVLLREEVVGRDAATRRMRRKQAAFPTGKTFSSWRAEESSIPQATQNSLMTLEWVGRAENLAVAGPSGTGKTHFVEALVHAAIEADLRVAWFTLETLTSPIGRAKVDGIIAHTVARVCRCDLIVVDDIGMLPAGQDAAEAFYRIVDAAYERRSVAVTSNFTQAKRTGSRQRVQGGAEGSRVRLTAQPRQPGMAGVGGGQRARQPGPIRIAELGQHGVEVGDVLGSGILGLEQQLDGRGEIGHAISGPQPDAFQRLGNGGVAAKHPAAVVAVGEHKLQAPRRVGGRPAPDAVLTSSKPLAVAPGSQAATGGDVQIPAVAGEQMLGGVLVVS